MGAGPAGATAALAALHADPALQVLLLDRSDFPRDKSCGDGIAPHCFEKLASIGVTGVEDGWTPLTRLELARGDESVAGTMARPVYVIPREVFDARLVERAVDRGATFRRERIVSIEMVSTKRSRMRSSSTGPSRRGSSSARTVRTPSSARSSGCRTVAARWRSAATHPRRRTGAAPR